MGTTTSVRESLAAEAGASLLSVADEGASRTRWYAVFTRPQNEKSVARHLAVLDVESFLPTFESVRQWKNRQRVRLTLPLFPCYLFVCIDKRDRATVLSSPGVLRIVGNYSGPVAIPNETINFLRSDFGKQNIEPYPEFPVGTIVRIRRGALRGLQGILVRRSNGFHFVLSIDLINQRAAVKVGPEDLELV
jgi:transcription antitermination factor NusG